MAYPQATEGRCLRYPENFGLHPTVTYETAVNMLLRAIPLSQQVPYSWGFVDKPSEGQVLLLYLPSTSSFPNDGIRYQEQESRYSIPVGHNRELEVMEIKCGFVPNSQDTTAWRLRRRYRLHKGGHPQLVLVHYTRGPVVPIIPSLMGQPVRAYPLRPINEPSVYIMGDKAGQKVYPSGGPGGPPLPVQHGMAPSAQGPFNPQTMLAQQNSNMEALERRRERERGRDRSASMGGRPPHPQRIEDDDSADESETISSRALAFTRYKRNHEIMNEVFNYAAFGERSMPTRSQPFSIFDKGELEEKTAKLAGEIEELEAAARQRANKARVSREPSQGIRDVTMDPLIAA